MKNLKLIVYDFDGVMTNNNVIIDQFGNESVIVNRSDGLAISKIKKMGIAQIIISSENNVVVSVRAQKLGIECLQGIDNKKVALTNYCVANEIDLKNVAFLGNDINDLEVMEMLNDSICPHDAHTNIKEISKIILKTKGGEGVIRELADLIFKNFKN